MLPEASANVSMLLPVAFLGHTAQTVAPLPLEKVPFWQGGQGVLNEAPKAVEKLPARQLVHVALEGAPQAVE